MSNDKSSRRPSRPRRRHRSPSDSSDDSDDRSHRSSKRRAETPDTSNPSDSEPEKSDHHRSRRKGGQTKSRSLDGDSGDDDDRLSHEVERSQRRIHSHNRDLYGSDEDNSSDNDRSSRRRDRSRSRSTRHRRRGESCPKPTVMEDLMMSLGISRAKSQCPPTREEEQRREEARARLRKAVKSGLTAGALEAWRMKSAEGTMGHKALRVALAAGAAGGLDTIVARHSTSQSKYAGLAESVVGGMATSAALGGKVQRAPLGGPADKGVTNLIEKGTNGLMTQAERRSAKMRQKYSDD